MEVLLCAQTGNKELGEFLSEHLSRDREMWGFMYLIWGQAIGACKTPLDLVRYLHTAGRRESLREARQQKGSVQLNGDCDSTADGKTVLDKIIRLEKDIAIRKALESLADAIVRLPAKSRRAILWVISEFVQTDNVFLLPQALIELLLSARQSGLSRPKPQTLHYARRKLLRILRQKQKVAIDDLLAA